MSTLLSISSSTSVCSVALTRDTELISLQETTELNSHSRMLNSFIEDAIKESGISYQNLDAVAIGEGPGSYTGLRIGTSAAKGLCYALDIPMIAVSTLQAMALGMKTIYKHEKQKAIYCPVIDARRMEVYTALYNYQIEEVEKVHAKIIDENSFSTLLNEFSIVFGGDGSQKIKTKIVSENAVFLDDFQNSSKYIALIAHELYLRKEFVDVAYFEPFYLKDFVPEKARVKGLS